ncbi:MAG: hypothetical protein QGI49_06305, partial [SAR202 cluster bacterium]|nr:hypothetical protein [SAR202 cluster bacterium]
MSKLQLSVSAALTLLIALSVGTALAQEPVLISAEKDFEGSAVIHDDEALSDAITFTMTNVPKLDEALAYVGWLISDDESTILKTGAMILDDGSISHIYDSLTLGYTGENLIRGYDRLIITVESLEAEILAPSGEVVFSYKVPADVIEHVRNLVADWPPGSGIGIFTNLISQIKVALAHARVAADKTSIEDIRNQIELAVNALEGPDGDNYGDLDGDGVIEDIGDGVGVVARVRQRGETNFVLNPSFDDTLIMAHLVGLEMDGLNIENFVDEAVAEALLALDELVLDRAKVSAAGVAGFIEGALKGVDTDASDVIDSILGEGGAVQAYVEAQLMATYSLQVGPIPTPTPTPTAAPPTATPNPGVAGSTLEPTP